MKRNSTDGFVFAQIINYNYEVRAYHLIRMMENREQKLFSNCLKVMKVMNYSPQ